MRCRYKEKIYFCGDYVEIDIYPEFKKPGGRSKKFRPTTEVQEKLNQHNAERELVRTANTNFGPGDIKFELTYEDRFLPSSYEQAIRDRGNFIKRLKRHMKRKGLPELKAIFTTEMGSKTGRYHHHFIINADLPLKEIMSVWKMGYVDKYNYLLFDEHGITGLAVYFAKKTMPGKRWSSTRNLEKPAPKERSGEVTHKLAKEMFSNSDDRRMFEEFYNGEKLNGRLSLFKSGPGKDGLQDHEKYYCSDTQAEINPFNTGYYLCVRMYKRSAGVQNISNITAHRI